MPIEPDLVIERVLIPLLEPMIPTSVTLPLEMLAASQTYRRLDAALRHLPTPKVVFCGMDVEPIRTTGGLRICPDVVIEESGYGSLVLIPALWRNPIASVHKFPRLQPWITGLHQHGATFLAAGTGVALVAETGLLNQHPATTHWFYLQQLQKQYPQVDFRPNHLITRADRIYCAGSVNSVADLMIHLLGRAYGRTIAAKVEQQFSHEIRKSADDSLYTEGHISHHEDEAVVDLQSFMHEHFAQSVELNDLCNRSGLQPRTLARRFQQATGSSPMQYLTRIRMEQARDLLKNTNLNIHEVAEQVGFSDTDYFSRRFKSYFQLTPSAFRKSVRGKLFCLN